MYSIGNFCGDYTTVGYATLLLCGNKKSQDPVTIAESSMKKAERKSPQGFTTFLIVRHMQARSFVTQDDAFTAAINALTD